MLGWNHCDLRATCIADLSCKDRKKFATLTWRETAKAVGAGSAEITRMTSAFEHDDLTRAMAI